ncbi:MAG: lipid A deacylase LpxR family protein [Pseudomonadota bacterium]
MSGPDLGAEERVIEDDKGIFNVVIENDIFAAADRDYTNGIRFSWLSPEENIPELARAIARRLPLADDGNKRISILENEPGVILTYERKWRKIYEFSPFGLGTDFTPHVGFNLGNINTDGSAGATLRLGYDLPADYGPPRIRPSQPGSDFFIPTKTLGGYLFTTVDARAVARNIFLDGSTFKDSPHVNKKKLVNSLQLGAAVTYGQTRLSYTHVLLTREYTTQRRKAAFGALTLYLFSTTDLLVSYADRPT